jgi:excinuclease ABC subunit C
MSDAKGRFEEKLKKLPLDPGVYLMKDADDVIIYVGKAKSLRKRVSSYFQKTDHDPKTATLVRQISDFEFIATDSEIEALLLENTLIKKHMPKYNIRLKDDKRYPYIAVTTSEEYPRVIYTRSVRHGSDRYFGPYTDAFSAKNTVELINRLFRLRTCAKKIPLRDGERPCLNFQMKRCSGVCVGEISRDEYLSLVQNALLFLEGNIDPVIANLTRAMEEHSSRMRFEKAAAARDMIFGIQRISERQKVYTPAGYDQDFIAAAERGDEAIAVLFEFRKGILLGRKVSLFQNARYVSVKDTLRSFLIEYYARADIPQRIVIAETIDDMELIESHLAQRSGHPVHLNAIRTPEDRSVINLILKNIDLLFAEQETAPPEPSEGLSELQEILSLPMYPETIACFDISNIQGQFPVASMSFFTGGVPDKKRYRTFNIRGYEGANDPGMIHEAVSRYLMNCINEEWQLADLILIDGGPTQLTRAIEAARALDTDVPVISIAKKLEEIYIDPEAEPLRLDERSRALKILQNLRDEAHRFGITAHRKRRGKSTLTSSLESIDGIGEKKRTALLTHFKSIEKIKEAGIDDLSAVDGISVKDAETIHAFFHDIPAGK